MDIDAFRHDHAFLGARHDRNARRTWAVIALCAVTMVIEIGGGVAFNSMALLADGLHMATHAGAMLIAALAYVYARRWQADPRFSFGTGKLGDLSAFASAIILAFSSLLIGWESVERLLSPESIRYNEAIVIAVLGLTVNLASAWLLRDDHDHHGHGHGHGHDHDHAHEHDHGHHDGHGHHHDLNLRAAYIHVASDAAISLLAIVGLVLGRQFGWVWMDPVMGVIGALVIARWSFGLVRTAAAVLLDMRPGEALPQAVLKRLEVDGDRVCDLHVWRIGPGHNAAVVTVVSRDPQAPGVYKAKLAGLATLSHVTIEVEPAESLPRSAT
jgi:cation diffusion facilitator family transporter